MDIGFRFETGDTVEIDGILYERVSQSRDQLNLVSLGSARIPRCVKNDEFWALYHEKRPDADGQRLVVRRGLLGVLPNAVSVNLDRVLDDFDVRWQNQALKRLDYVEICDKLFSPTKLNRRKRFPKRPEGFARAAWVVSRLRYRRAKAFMKPGDDMPKMEVVKGSTLRDWYRRWVHSGRQLKAILPCHDAKGRFGVRLDGEVVEILGRWINEKYLTLECPDATVVFDCALTEINAKNRDRLKPLKAPTYDTFLRCLKAWTTPYDRMLKRDGPKAAEQMFRHVKRAPQATRPLQVVEIDHTPMDVLLVDDEGRPSRGDKRNKPTFRVWLTVARCQATKMIFGFHLSKDSPSWTSVMAALSMGVQQKSLDGLDVKSPWPVFGVPEVLKMDNGVEFHSKSLRAAAGQLRMELRYMPRGKPHLKGGIERVQGVLNHELTSFLPGRTFANPQERGDYPSARRAAVTFAKLHEMVTIYIVDILHNRPMGSLLGRTPLQAWRDLAGFGVRMPPNATDLGAILSLAIDRTVNNSGVMFLGLLYQSKELQAIRKREGHLGHRLLVKVDPYDIGSVLVFDEGHADKKGRWISVPCLYPELSDSVSVKQWKETVDLARQRTEIGKRVALATLRDARRLLVDMGTRVGAKPSKVSKADVDWAREHVDDPWFSVAPDETSPPESPASGDGELRRRRGRPRRNAAAQPDAQVGDGGHASAAPSSANDVPRADGDNTATIVVTDPVAAPQADTPVVVARLDDDYEDPTTWES
jgi:putative transposase